MMTLPASFSLAISRDDDVNDAVSSRYPPNGVTLSGHQIISEFQHTLTCMQA